MVLRGFSVQKLGIFDNNDSNDDSFVESEMGSSDRDYIDDASIVDSIESTNLATTETSKSKKGTKSKWKLVPNKTAKPPAAVKNTRSDIADKDPGHETFPFSSWSLTITKSKDDVPVQLLPNRRSPNRTSTAPQHHHSRHISGR